MNLIGFEEYLESVLDNIDDKILTDEMYYKYDVDYETFIHHLYWKGFSRDDSVTIVEAVLKYFPKKEMFKEPKYHVTVDIPKQSDQQNQPND